jgi:hypothetical protein
MGTEPAEGQELADTVAVEAPTQGLGIGLADGPAAILALDQDVCLGHVTRIRVGLRLT